MQNQWCTKFVSKLCLVSSGGGVHCLPSTSATCLSLGVCVVVIASTKCTLLEHNDLMEVEVSWHY